MRTYILMLLTCLGTALPQAAGAWWQAEWPYRKPITIDGGTQGAGLGGEAGRMPVLVRLHSGNFNFNDVHESGSDLRFVAADDKTVLNHQIEQFDPLLGLALIWVHVPAIGGTPQRIWMYYGNKSAPASANGQLTFDTDYTLVYHFGEIGTPARDTTAYGNHSQTPVTSVDMVIGKGARLTGSPLMLPASPSLAVQAGGALTFSAVVRPEQLGAQQIVYARRDGANELLIGIDQGVPFVQVNGQRSAPGQPVQAAQPSHLAVTAEGKTVTLYVNGRPAGSVAVALPALNTPAAIGADAPGATRGGGAANYTALVGAIDEVRLSKVARPAALVLADAVSQSADSRLVAFGPDEQQAGKSHFGFLLAAMPIDAWIVIGILGAMMIVSWLIMLDKSRTYGAITRANQVFKDQFRQAAGAPLDSLGQAVRVPTEVKTSSTLWRLYSVGVEEMRRRHERGYDLTSVSTATIGAIRAAMDAVMVQENERLSLRMNWLSTTIEGAPYVGLFGTVIGIMLVFIVAAMAGVVDINSVAPGMAAALLCTAAGLGVAIPALFGYNWLSARAEAIGAAMEVFIDEFVTRLAEEQGEGRAPSGPHGVTPISAAQRPCQVSGAAAGGGLQPQPAAPHRI